MGIEIEQLSFRYKAGIDALKDVSLTVQQGECVALLGHNGSGKSTLTKHLNGLLRPSQGVVKINGIATIERRVAQLAGTVALLFQNPDNQICKRTVWEEAAFGPKNLGYREERVLELTNASLAAFDLLAFKECNPHDLGYSERKRLAIASVLAMDTGIVVLDEPTAGLDPREISMLEAVLRQLRRDEKIVLIISHDMDFIAENVSRAICLENGRKRFDGSVTELFEDQSLLERCGLLPPQVVQLSSHYKFCLQALTPENFIEKFIDSLTET
jgi:energy-coupling factor transport system ATP-binding protein